MTKAPIIRNDAGQVSEGNREELNMLVNIKLFMSTNNSDSLSKELHTYSVEVFRTVVFWGVVFVCITHAARNDVG